MTAWLLNTSTGRNILAIGAALVAVLAVIGGLMRAAVKNERQAAQNRAVRAERATHERLNNAPTLRNATDPERVDWLRKYAKRNTP